MASTTGIYFRGDTVLAVRMEGSAKKPRIGRAAAMTFDPMPAVEEGEAGPTPEAIHENRVAQLKAWLKKQKLAGGSVALCVDASEVLYRDMNIAFKDRRQIDKVITYQVEGLIPSTPIEDLAVGYTILDATDEGSRLLISAAHKARLRANIDLLEEVGVLVETADSTLGGALNLRALRPELAKVGAPTVWVDFQGERAMIALLKDDKVVTARGIMMPAAVNEEIRSAAGGAARVPDGTPRARADAGERETEEAPEDATQDGGDDTGIEMDAVEASDGVDTDEPARPAEEGESFEDLVNEAAAQTGEPDAGLNFDDLVLEDELGEAHRAGRDESETSSDRHTRRLGDGKARARHGAPSFTQPLELDAAVGWRTDSRETARGTSRVTGDGRDSTSDARDSAAGAPSAAIAPASGEPSSGAEVALPAARSRLPQRGRTGALVKLLTIEVRRLMMSSPVDLSVKALVISGLPEGVRGSVSALEDELGLESVEFVDLLQGIVPVDKKGEPKIELPATPVLAATAGVAMKLLGADASGVNFRTGDLSLGDAFDEIKNPLAVGATLLFLVAGVCLMLVLKERNALRQERAKYIQEANVLGAMSAAYRDAPKEVREDPKHRLPDAATDPLDLLATVENTMRADVDRIKSGDKRNYTPVYEADRIYAKILEAIELTYGPKGPRDFALIDFGISQRATGKKAEGTATFKVYLDPTPASGGRGTADVLAANLKSLMIPSLNDRAQTVPLFDGAAIKYDKNVGNTIFRGEEKTAAGRPPRKVELFQYTFTCPLVTVEQAATGKAK